MQFYEKLVQVKKLVKNKIFLFTINKYFVYFIRFISSIIIAQKLGPYLLGVWGLLNLIIEYFCFSSLGIEYSVNVELSISEKQNHKIISKINSNSIFIIIILSVTVIILGFSLKALNLELINKYNLSEYLVLLSILAAFVIINKLLANIYRSFVYLFRIGLTDFLYGFIPFICLLVFPQRGLIDILIITMLFVQITNTVIFLYKFPFASQFSLDFLYIKKLISIGLNLFIFNVSYTAIFTIARTVIGVYYSASEMGYFTLAYNITNAVLLGSNAVIYAIYPKILWKLREGINNKEVEDFVKYATSIYSTFLYLFVFIVMLIFPISLIYLKNYSPIVPALNFLLLSQAIYSASMIHATLCFARKKTFEAAKLSTLSLLVFLVISFLIGYLKLNFSYVALAVVFSIAVYSILQIKYANHLLSFKISYFASLKQLLPTNFLLPTLIVIIFNISGFSHYSGVLGLTVFILLNRKRILESRTLIKGLL